MIIRQRFVKKGELGSFYASGNKERCELSDGSVSLLFEDFHGDSFTLAASTTKQNYDSWTKIWIRFLNGRAYWSRFKDYGYDWVLTSTSNYLKKLLKNKKNVAIPLWLRLEA